MVILRRGQEALRREERREGLPVKKISVFIGEMEWQLGCFGFSLGQVVETGSNRKKEDRTRVSRRMWGHAY